MTFFFQASFSVSDNRTDIDINDPNFWQKWAKKADLDVDMMTNKVTEHSSAALLFPTSVTHSTSPSFCLAQDTKLIYDMLCKEDTIYERKEGRNISFGMVRLAQVIQEKERIL